MSENGLNISRRGFVAGLALRLSGPGGGMLVRHGREGGDRSGEHLAGEDGL